ncbi:MAG: MGMT family protein [Dokdonella sp.]|nr:MGMT family protein [Dokdonella sp.]
MAGLSADPSAEARILSAIRDVPRGSVAGYGQIARRAGLPGRARLVARLLSRGGDDSLPWHRILRSDGRIAFPPGSSGFREQVRRLRAEGVAVVDGRVRMPRGEDELDAVLWGPRPR